MTIPKGLREFNIKDAGLIVWLFKKSGGANGATPIYTGRWITVDDELSIALKTSVTDARARIQEVQEYGLLAQNNEESALLIDTIETNAGLIVEQSANALPQKKIQTEKQITNTDFFVVRLTNGDDVLHAVRRTEPSWRTQKRKALIDIVYRENALALDQTPNFSLTTNVDFFIANEKIIIPHKANFESILSYRQAHAEDFLTLQGEAAFSQVFSSLQPLAEFVGTNKIQLRRMCSIRQKGHYRNANFIALLRQHHAAHGLSIEFDANGLIVPTPETCSDIITALLDHRLASSFSNNIYNVPDATKVV